MHAMTRRDFVKAVAGAVAIGVGGIVPAAESVPGKNRFPIIAFSKAFQMLSYEQTADLVAEVGWDGIECPVRAKGQVEPERVEEDLPRLVEIMKKRQREVAIITTDVREVTPLNEKVLRTAAKLGIRKYRLAHWKYTKAKSLTDQLKELQASYRDLAALNGELGIQAGYQNHSGGDYIGAAIWDVYSVLKEFDPRQIAMHFDIGHATLDGGTSWPIQARLVQPILGAVYIKDFFWEKGERGWQAKWCPLGQGMVRKSFLDELKRSSYAGPISQHHEYLPADASRDALAALFKKDLEVLRTWLA